MTTEELRPVARPATAAPPHPRPPAVGTVPGPPVAPTGGGAFDAVARKLGRAAPAGHDWAADAAGERQVARALDPLEVDGIVVLHDRRVRGARSTIDHLVVGPMGIYVIDTKRYAARRVEVRETGGLRARDPRLFVGGRDAMKLIQAAVRLRRMVERRVGERVAALGGGVTPVLCFADAEWNPFVRSFQVDGVAIESPRTIAMRCRRIGPLDADAIGGLTDLLDDEFPTR